MTTGVSGSPMPLRPSSRLGRFLPSERLAFALVGFVGLLVAWQLASDLKLISKLLLSSPALISKAALVDFASGRLWPQIRTSLSEWLLGFGVSFLIGVPLGMAVALSRRLDYLLGMWLTAAYNTPVVALVPLIVLVAGIRIEAKVIVVVIVAVFSILVSTSAGVRAVDRHHLEIAQSFGASRWRVLNSVIIPSTMPFILTGVRVGVGRALVGVVVAEFLVASEGLGFYITFSSGMLDTARVYLGIILFGAFGVLTAEAVRVVERRFEAWRPEIK